MIFTTIIFGFVYLLFSFVPTGLVFLIMFYAAIFGFIMVIYNSLFYTLMQLRVPSDKLGRVSSIDSTLSTIIIPLGSILSGPLTIIIGIGPLFFICGTSIMILEIVVYFFTKIRALDYEDDTSPGLE
jgi:hypothetical protein